MTFPPAIVDEAQAESKFLSQIFEDTIPNKTCSLQGFGPATWNLWSWLWPLSTMGAELQRKPVFRKPKKGEGNALKEARMRNGKDTSSSQFLDSISS